MQDIGTDVTALDEAIAPRNISDFTKVRQARPSGNDRDAIARIAFYKLLMTLSNMHSTVSDTYLANDVSGRAGYHMELSVRFRSEANKIKNS